jgi:murein hydrolase activator
MNANRYIVLLVFFLVSLCAQAQSGMDKEKLEKERKENLQRIKRARKILQETANRKSSSLGQLTALNEQVAARRALIASINREIELLGNQIDEISMVTNALERDLKNLKSEYRAMLYAAEKAQNGYDRLTFLFSSSSFNQLYMRLKYMEQYSKARNHQVELINEVKLSLESQQVAIKNKRMERNILLDQQVNANKEMVALQRKQQRLVANLSRKERQLNAELANREQAVKELDNLLASIVRREIAAKKNLAGKNDLSASFEKQHAKLNWPVSSGFISQQFGRHPHPVLKGIMIENQGIDIQTSQNSEVSTVYDGIVKTIAAVPGMNKVVIVQHGDYYTLYARLKEVYVKKGQELRQKEKVGKVYTDKDGIASLQFQIWRQHEKLNPQPWLQHR